MAGAQVVGFGGPGDEAKVDDALQGLPKGQGHNRAGQLRIDETAVALSLCDVFIGNDSGLMHIAAAAGITTFGLFGPTDERLYGPWGKHAHAIRAGAQIDATARATLRHVDASLLTDLSVDQVEASVVRILESAIM
jgi:ADP-heptose:LPS heptosyltransferase